MKTIHLAIIIFLIGNIAGCQHGEQKKIQETIRQYCLLLAEGYQDLNMSKLRFVATEDQTAKIYNHMAAIGESRRKMVSKLLAINFLLVQEEPKKRARVQTKEKWNYNYLNIDSGKTELSNTVTYTLLYHLEKVTDHWLVAAIDIEQSTQGHDQPIPSFVNRPTSKPINKSPHKGNR